MEISSRSSGSRRKKGKTVTDGAVAGLEEGSFDGCVVLVAEGSSRLRVIASWFKIPSSRVMTSVAWTLDA